MSRKKKNDLLVVGELNIDLILNQLNLPPQFGKEQRADEMTLTLGSSTAIFASNCSSLGATVTFCGKIGKDSFGEFVLDSLAANGVNADSVIVDENLKTGATIILNHNNDRMMVTHPGAMEHMTVEEVPAELFENSRHIHTSAIFFQPGIKNNLKTLFGRAKEHGLTTSMDTQWDPEEKWDINLNHLLPVLDFFLPNDDELMALTNSHDVETALDQLSGFNTCIVVKRGKQGAIMQKHGKRVSIPAYNVEDNFVDAIGAGDSFNAGFITTYLKGKSLQECLEFGNLTAAVSTTEAGGTNAIKSYENILEVGKNFEHASA